MAPSVSYTAAVKAMSTELRLRVVHQLTVWRNAPQWGQIVDNIEKETALPSADFGSLLRVFGEYLAQNKPPEVAWQAACQRPEHQFCGAVLPLSDRPEVVGRALSIAQYADQMSSAGTHLNVQAARKLIRDYGNRNPSQVPAWVQRTLRVTPVGRHVVWATFDESNRQRDPFGRLLTRTADVVTALGLGHLAAEESLVLLAYRPLRDSKPEPLHRPTIAEAASWPLYRPHSVAEHPYGYTLPLPPNAGQLPPQPEVVHRPILGEGLLFPFRLSTQV